MANGKRALAGAAGGAAVGSAFGPWGTAIGGGIGLLSGMFGGGDDGNDAAQAGLAQSRAGLIDLQKSQRRQRGADLNRALGMFGPTDQYMNEMYGVPMPTPFALPDGPSSSDAPPAPAADPASGLSPNKYAAQQEFERQLPAPNPVANKYVTQQERERQRRAQGYFR